MNYEKLTPETFATKLKNNQYESLTGARRAIGKASWAESDKEAARGKALKFFGDNGTPAKKTASAPKKTAVKAAPAAKTAAVKAVKAKAGRKPAAESSDTVEPKAPPIGQDQYAEVFQRAKNVTMADVRKNPHAIIQLATHGVQAGTSVLNTLAALKQQDPSLNISDSVDAANATVKASLHLTSLVLDSLSEGIEGKASHEKVTIETKEEEAEEEVQANGITAPGTTTYEAPVADSGT